MNWVGATFRALGIVLFFVAMTVWLPSRLLAVTSIAEASPAVRDAVAVGSWGIWFVVGIAGLRTAQKKGWI